jgi:hypothetical protein
VLDQDLVLPASGIRARIAAGTIDGEPIFHSAQQMIGWQSHCETDASRVVAAALAGLKMQRRIVEDLPIIVHHGAAPRLVAHDVGRRMKLVHISRRHE